MQLLMDPLFWAGFLAGIASMWIPLRGIPLIARARYERRR